MGQLNVHFILPHDACLEAKTENYQVCSVQYCVQQLCTVQYTHIQTDQTVLWSEFCLNGPISLCLDSFLWPPYVIGGPLYFCPVISIFYLSIFFFFSSPNLSGRRLDDYHSLTHGVALVQI